MSDVAVVLAQADGGMSAGLLLAGIVAVVTGIFILGCLSLGRRRAPSALQETPCG